MQERESGGEGRKGKRGMEAARRRRRRNTQHGDGGGGGGQEQNQNMYEKRDGEHRENMREREREREAERIHTMHVKREDAPAHGGGAANEAPADAGGGERGNGGAILSSGVHIARVKRETTNGEDYTTYRNAQGQTAPAATVRRLGSLSTSTTAPPASAATGGGFTTRRFTPRIVKRKAEGGGAGGGGGDGSGGEGRGRGSGAGISSSDPAKRYDLTGDGDARHRSKQHASAATGNDNLTNIDDAEIAELIRGGEADAQGTNRRRGRKGIKQDRNAAAGEAGRTDMPAVVPAKLEDGAAQPSSGVAAQSKGKASARTTKASRRKGSARTTADEDILTDKLEGVTLVRNTNYVETKEKEIDDDIEDEEEEDTDDEADLDRTRNADFLPLWLPFTSRDAMANAAGHEEPTSSSTRYPGSVEELIDSSSGKTFFTIQMPERLPVRMRDRVAGGGGCGGGSSDGGDGEMMSDQDTSRVKHAAAFQSLRDIPLETTIGKLLVYDDHSVQMVMGDVHFDLKPGSETNLAQELLHVETTQALRVGDPTKRVVMVPDIAALLSST